VILAIANRKGGVGKTTIAVAVATKLASTTPTLLIDLDSQANATESLGIQLKPHVAKWLMFNETPELDRYGKLDVLAGNADTRKVDLALASEGRIYGIAELLRPITQYEWIVLDCPPSITMVTQAALYAADLVLCPTILEYLSLAGVRQMMGIIKQLQDAGRPIKMLGIQPNMYRSTNEHKAQLMRLVKVFGAWPKGAVWPVLRQTIRIAEASEAGKPVWGELDGDRLLEWENLVERVRQ